MSETDKHDAPQEAQPGMHNTSNAAQPSSLQHGDAVAADVSLSLSAPVDGLAAAVRNAVDDKKWSPEVKETTKENKSIKDDDRKEGEGKKSKKSGSSRSRRERRERHAAAQVASMYGWDDDSRAWGYGTEGAYPMDYDLGTMGIDPMTLEAMSLDPYMNAMSMGMNGYVDPMSLYGDSERNYTSPRPAGSVAAATATAVAAAAGGKPKTTESKGASEGLSIHAKPWSPSAESTMGYLGQAAQPLPKNNKIDVRPPSWTTIDGVNGEKEVAPAAMVHSEVSNNVFVHSLVVVPQSNPEADLEFFIYKCARCPLRTLYGRLSSRRADVTISNISPDVPPMCLAHLLEQVAKVRITALVASSVSGNNQYDMWLDKTSMAGTLINTVTGALWMCPFAHGFAVVARSDQAKVYLNDYLAGLKSKSESTKSSYPLVCVEIKEH